MGYSLFEHHPGEGGTDALSLKLPDGLHTKVLKGRIWGRYLLRRWIPMTGDQEIVLVF